MTVLSCRASQKARHQKDDPPPAILQLTLPGGHGRDVPAVFRQQPDDGSAPRAAAAHARALSHYASPTSLRLWRARLCSPWWVLFVVLASSCWVAAGFDFPGPNGAAVPLTSLTVGYAFFAAGADGRAGGLIPDETQSGRAQHGSWAWASVWRAAACFPPQALPVFLRERITPLLPTHWFVETARNLQKSGVEVMWVAALVKMLVLGAVLLALAALLFRRQFRRQRSVHDNRHSRHRSQRPAAVPEKQVRPTSGCLPCRWRCLFDGFCQSGTGQSLQSQAARAGWKTRTQFPWPACFPRRTRHAKACGYSIHTNRESAAALDPNSQQLHPPGA